MDKKTHCTPIYFIGAGPGDPELLTVKAKRLLEQADVIVFTGSLVPRSVIRNYKAKIHDSAGLHLEQVLDILEDGFQKGKKVVRLHTGDPSLYSAIGEQIRYLKKKAIPFKVIPGVTAGFAAAASLGTELTVPEKIQTVIISRVSGRTPVPQKESLEILSQIGASLILYLSVGHIDKVVEDLAKGYPMDTPVAVVEKATWPDERVVIGKLSDIATKVKGAGIKKTAVIIVGNALRELDSPGSTHSRLYNRTFSHGFRKGTETREKKGLIHAFSADSLKEKGEALIVYLGKKGKEIAENLKAGLDSKSELISFARLKENKLLSKRWNEVSAIFFICACQIAVRTIAPFIKDKYSDPAVISIDESAQNVVCILSGHLGGGNKLTKKAASILGARAVITTQSDLMDIPALDLWARANNLIPSNKKRLKDAQAHLRNNKELDVYLQRGIDATTLPEGLELTDSEEEADIVIGPFVPGNPRALHLITRNLFMGTGCHKGLDPSRLVNRSREFLSKHSIHPWAIRYLATIDQKGNEPAIVELAGYLGADLKTFSAQELNRLTGIKGSDTVKKAVGARAVAEPASLLCSPGAILIVKKQKFDCCTFAVSMEKVRLENQVK